MEERTASKSGHKMVLSNRKNGVLNGVIYSDVKKASKQAESLLGRLFK